MYLHGGSVALWDHLVLHLFNNFSRQFSYSELSSTFLVTQDTSVFTLISQGGTCKNQLPLLAFTDQFKAICLACDLLTILLKLKIEWILNWYVPHTEYMYFFHEFEVFQKIYGYLTLCQVTVAFSLLTSTCRMACSLSWTSTSWILSTKSSTPM